MLAHSFVRLVTLIQRTYVLYQRDNRVLALMVSVAVGLLGLSGVSFNSPRRVVLVYKHITSVGGDQSRLGR